MREALVYLMSQGRYLLLLLLSKLLFADLTCLPGSVPAKRLFERLDQYMCRLVFLSSSLKDLSHTSLFPSGIVHEQVLSFPTLEVV